VAPAALLACAGAVVGLWLALNGGGSGSGSPTGHPGGAARHAAHAAPAKSASSGGGSSGGAVANGSGGGGSVTSAAAVPAAGSGSPAEGAQLNDEGYSLIQQGRYSEAVPILRRAVASFPSGTTDINYAYALYNLGHALRMAGQPDAAIPILERRLQIPDQTATVQAELDAARAAAGR
jgi:serine/threonine-protein kinase